MKWEMEVDEIEAVLEKIWDLHDKLSDAIHSISRAHFLSSIKSLKTNNKKLNSESDVGFEEKNNSRASGFVFVKDSGVDDNDFSAIQEAKSLNSIRTALENLEDQLEFFHTVQIHQRAERDAAIARLEQSRIILAVRLAEHHGKKYKVIEEALAFVGDSVCVPENLYGSPTSPSGENLVRHEGKGPNMVIKVLLSSFEFAKKSLKVDHMGGILGNAALFTVSMIAMLHLHQVAYKDHPYKQEDLLYSNRNGKKVSGLEGSSSNGRQPFSFNLILHTRQALLSCQMDKKGEIALAQMRKAVQNLGGSTERYGDPTLTRFLKARSMNPEKAAKMFVQWQTWRASFVPKGFIPESEIPDELASRKGLFAGFIKRWLSSFNFQRKQAFSLQGSPSMQEYSFSLFLSRFSLSCDIYRTRKRHLTPILIPFWCRFCGIYVGQSYYKNICLRCFRAIKEHEIGNEKFIVLVDFRQLTYKNFDPRGLINVVQFMQAYYPERIAKMYMLFMPRFFRSVWNMVCRYLDKGMREKTPIFM
uniref:CRAL-TRIO domain-containing protein n=1 Tax=Salix viminalis TaxID=40686 RepID=A0A6N2MFI1_SALVM